MKKKPPRDFDHDRMIGVIEANTWINRIRIILAIALVVILTGLITW